jgi:glycosyltransferase involved in cell wall biosynthesis
MPCVAVVVPTKDRLRSLQRVLPSFLAQPEVAEVVVVIDGSTDGTREFLGDLVATESRVRVVDNGRNRGVPFSKNAGIDASTSEYVFIGEDDLELADGFFTVLLDHLERSGAEVICGRNIWRYEGESSASAIARTDLEPGPQVDLRLVAINTSVRLDDDSVQPLIASPMLARAEVFRRVRYDERFVGNFWREESDFQLSVQEAGGVLVSCPHAICFNYMLNDDRGGVHASVGAKRLAWITLNNWRFFSKHRTFIHEHFEVGSRLGFLARSAGSVFWAEMALPRLVQAKRRLAAAR